MTRQLRHELHALVDDAPTVDVIDRALGTARGLRHRRTGAGVTAALAVAAALVTPLALVGSGRGPGLAGGPADSDCAPGMTGPATSGAGSGIPAAAGYIVAHLPSGYTVARTKAVVWCGSPGPRAVQAYYARGADGGQVWVELVAHADRVPGTIYAGAPPLIATSCTPIFDPALPPSSPVINSGAPWPSTASELPSAGPSGAAPSPSDSWPSFTPSESPSDSWPSFTPSESPSVTPSDSPSESEPPVISPSPSDSWPSFTPSQSPSGSVIDSPSGSMTWTPSGSPAVRWWVSVLPGSVLPPLVKFCQDPTAASPMVYGYVTGLGNVVVAVWPDHRAIVARAVPADVQASGGGPVTVDRLTALVTDPELLARVWH